MKNKAAAPNLDLSMLSKADDLKKRIFFSLLLLIVYRFGSYVPLPGIDSVVLQDIAKQNSSGVLGVFNMLSGGSLGRMSIFALSIMPYITSSIVIQLLCVISKKLEALKKEGASGRKIINQYTRIATVILALFQSYGLAVGLESMSSVSGVAVPNPGFFHQVTVMTTLTGGTVFLMWLGEQITSRGIGNGISLIIFSGIVAGLPSAIGTSFELARTGALSEVFVLTIFVIAVVMVGFIVFVEKSSRKVFVQYPKRQVGNKIYGGENTHIPLKINTAGVIPPIFASSLLLFPTTIVNFSNAGNSEGILANLAIYLAHGKPLYMLLFAALIIVLTFFYTTIMFNAEETANNLKNNGGIIPGRRPGNQTKLYFEELLSKLTLIGAVYLVVLCTIPEILISHFSVPFYLGGTSILIVVNVVMDTTTQVQTHLFSHQYEKLISKSKAISRRR